MFTRIFRYLIFRLLQGKGGGIAITQILDGFFQRLALLGLLPVLSPTVENVLWEQARPEDSVVLRCVDDASANSLARVLFACVWV